MLQALTIFAIWTTLAFGVGCLVGNALNDDDDDEDSRSD